MMTCARGVARAAARAERAPVLASARVPDRTGATMPAAVSTPGEDQVSAKGTKNSVLIVDDEESVRELLAIVLENDFRSIDTAATGEEGLEKALDSSYDVIITDLKMPGLGGGVFHDCLHARLAERTPRFIFMTGDVLGGETQKLLERTGALCILKPFDIYQAREIIQRSLEAKRSLEEKTS